MSIVLNEYEWAQRAISNKELGNKPYETLTRVAKYYTYTGHTPSEVRADLEAFMKSCDRSVSIVTWSDTIDRAVKYAGKYKLIVIDGVDITKKELDVVNGLKGVQLQRLAFTLLCISKYMYKLNAQTDHWVSTPENEIMRMANIHASELHRSSLYSRLREVGLIRFSKMIDNLSVQVLFADESGANVVMTVSDFRNIGYQYMMLNSSGYYVCAECGLVCKESDKKNAAGRKRKYCPDCAVKVHTKQKVDSVMRLRREANLNKC